MKDFFKHLNDVLFPPPKRNTCPHCGGGKCFGMCSVSDGKSEPGAQCPNKENQPAAPPGPDPSSPRRE